MSDTPPPNWWKTAPRISTQGGHDWILDWTGKYQCCRVCGMIRRADGTTRPCSGPALITTRKSSNALENVDGDA